MNCCRPSQYMSGGFKTTSNNFIIFSWAATWQNQQNECAPSENSDQPGHPPSLIRVFVRLWVAKDTSFLHADSEDSDQTGRMPRLTFAGRTVTLLVCHVAAHLWETWEKKVYICQNMTKQSNNRSNNQREKVQYKHVHIIGLKHNSFFLWMPYT